MNTKNKQNIIVIIILILSGINLVFAQDEENTTNRIIEITRPEDWTYESTREVEKSFSPDRKAFIKKISTNYTDLDTATESVVADYLKKEFTNIKELSSENDETDGLLSVLTTYKATAKTDRKPVHLTTQLVTFSDDSESRVVLYIGVVNLPDRKKIQDTVSQILRSIRIEMVEKDINAPVSVIPQKLPGFSNTTTSDAPTGSAVSAIKCPDSKLTEAEVLSVLKQHNDARAEVGVPPLKWDCRLANYAQKWANQGNTEHSSDEQLSNIIPGIRVGENLAWHSDPKAPPGFSGWMEEKPFWDNGNATCKAGEVCGHYTQIVWRTTTHVGCGINRNAPGEFKQFFVCNYSPGGNDGGSAY